MIRPVRSDVNTPDPSNPTANRERTARLVVYVPRSEATSKMYEALGFRCGLEIHQQLKTAKKLFCRCPAGRYQSGDDFDAQLVRHMRPTLSELGEYDGTALMEFKTRKNIVYRIKGETACTYDIDDTPPFPLNRDALAIAMQIALLLDTSLVGELHITRKQYLDGSIPTGFQRTAIVGIDGSIPVASKHVGIRQLSIEEDSCREVSDRGHERVYTTDRLGMPLVETVTEPELLTPGEAAEAADYLRYLVRSTGLVNTGIGAAREDVNVSIEGGTRVEIKGVQHIRWIPELTHNEAFRQKALLMIRDELRARCGDPDSWSVTSSPVERSDVPRLVETYALAADVRIQVIHLPGFAGLLSFFTSPGRCFADELSDRLKVIACVDRPNMTHSEETDPVLMTQDWDALRRRLDAADEDSLVILWGPEADIPTAIETIDERCRWAFDGVPNETRKALPNGTTIFERVLPGPDRMYPDTDSAPIPIDESMIEAAREALPPLSVAEQVEQLTRWEVPRDAHAFILRRNLVPLVRRLHEDVGLPRRFAGCLVGHALRHAGRARPIDVARIAEVLGAASDRGLAFDILKPLVQVALDQPEADLDRLLERIDYRPSHKREILAAIDPLREQSEEDGLPAIDRRNWIMGRLRPIALGNVSLGELASAVEEALR
jgi:glutamyl-tRNA(Gln) amidotransferase subunit E